MFGFLCTHCGRMEILHRDRSELEGNASSGLWPDLEYQENGPLRQGEDVRVFFRRKRRYRYSLLDCPGFCYRQRDRGTVVELFAETALSNPWVTGFLPEWQDELAARIEVLQEAEAARYQNTREWDLEGGALVYIVFNSHSGVSACYYR